MAATVIRAFRPANFPTQASGPNSSSSERGRRVSASVLVRIVVVAALVLNFHCVGGSPGEELRRHGATRGPGSDATKSVGRSRPATNAKMWSNGRRRSPVARSTVSVAAVLEDAPHIGARRIPGMRDSGEGVVRDLKMALAGALAGAVATAVLFPIDTAKTLRQANPQAFRGTREALAHICRTRGAMAVYTGVPTAIIGAMPSSALYFGTYEAVKTRLMKAAAKAFPAGRGIDGEGGRDGARPRRCGSEGVHPAARAAAHAMAAACGNAASSLVFVPKEYVKQTLQASGMGAAGAARETATQIVRRTLREKGVQGLYRGYWATLSRNIPSAVIRFSLYEEIKLLLGPARLMSAPPMFLLAGALAGACASGVTTPFDVLKTRVATGSLDGGRGFARNMASIVADEGWKGLYVGFQPRVVMSGLFTAVGFGSFETFKTALGVSPLPSTRSGADTSNFSSSRPIDASRRLRGRASAMVVPNGIVDGPPEGFARGPRLGYAMARHRGAGAMPC